MTMRGHNLFLFGLLALASFLLLLPETAMAQVDLTDSGGSFTGLLDLIQQKAGDWDDRLRTYAIRLFWLLVSIQFVWTFFPLVFKQADFGEIVGELIRFIIVTGFFLALLTFSTDWGTAVVDSFRTAGGAAAGYGKALKPGDILAWQLSWPTPLATWKHGTRLQRSWFPWLAFWCCCALHSLPHSWG